jgi:hypothetical protein
MIIDGIFASQALDSSAEVLDIEGADISTLAQDGVLNWEHRGDQAPGASPNDIVGKVVYAKKIFKREDCENERQAKFYDTVKLPIIYGIARLADEAGHPGAVAAAAFIRDQIAHKEPLVLRFSIEGSTLHKDGNKLTSTVCRRVALTAKPCNRSAISDVLHDPAGKPAKEGDKLAEALEALGHKKSEVEDPFFKKLNESDTNTATVIEGDLEKAMTGGGGVSAPSSMGTGQALQREHIIGAIKKWDKKTPLREHLKRALPEADEDFIEKLADMTEEAYMPKRVIKKSEREETVLRAMRRLEAISIELKKARAIDESQQTKFQGQHHQKKAKDPEQKPKAFSGPIEFQGKQIQPGHMVRKGKNFAVIGHSPTHYLAVPHEVGPAFGPDDIRKVPRNVGGITMVRPLHEIASPKVLNAMQHGVFQVNRTPEQHSLIHGVDLNTPPANAPKGTPDQFWNKDSAHWRQVGDKKMGFVKKQGFSGPFNDARRETVFHNLAREFFGLGAHVPRSAVFQHPHSGEEHAVIEKAPGEHPIEDYQTGGIKKHQHAVLDKLQNEGGKLDRMAIMDMVLGNHDRHAHNYLIDSKGKNINLIDHGFSMDPESHRALPITNTPAYIQHHNLNNQQSTHTNMLHPEAAEWAHSLSPDALQQKMASMGVPQTHINAAVYRLQNLQQRLASKKGRITQQEMLHSPNLPAGVEVNYDDMNPHTAKTAVPGDE